jgi:hypothetical protein
VRSDAITVDGLSVDNRDHDERIGLTGDGEMFKFELRLVNSNIFRCG